ncbi:MAG: hypothetical protein WC655_29460, partial [Candidatus Hydrogenedentales bacterium]
MRVSSCALCISLLQVSALVSAAAVGQLARPEVAVSDTEIRVSFPGRPRIEAGLAVKDQQVLGLSFVSIDRNTILAPPSGETSPPLMTKIVGGGIAPITDLLAYLKERAATGERHTFPTRGEIKTAEFPVLGRFAGWRRRGKAIVIDVVLPSGRAEWWIAPATTRTYAGTYAGVSWQIRLYDVGSVYEISVDEPVDFAEGDWRLQQRGSQTDDKNEEEFRLSHQVAPNLPYSMSKRKYGARQQPFFFLAGTRGTTLSYFDRVSCSEVGESQKDDRIVLHSAIPLRTGAGGCLTTPVKSWVFRPADLSDKWTAINEWTWAWDRIVGDLQAQAAIKPTEPLPTLFHQQFDTPGLEYGVTPALRKSMTPPALEDSWLYHFANDMIHKAATWGIGVIELRAVLDTDIDHAEIEFPAGSFAADSVCSPWGLRISPKLGGEAGLAKLVRAAHAQDIKVAIWSAPAHQSVCSPVVRDHPEWLMFDASGRVINRSYVTLVGMDLAAGFRAYMEDGYRRLRGQTGLDGVWADSYCAFGADRDMSDALPYPQLDELVSLQHAMQRMGYSVLMKEDCGPFGLSTRSSGLSGVLGREYLRYYFLFNHSDPLKRYDPDSYFRTLASKGVMEIRVPREFEALPVEARDRIVRANFAYREVLPLLKRRFVLGDGETWQGVAWADRKGRTRVLFGFE